MEDLISRRTIIDGLEFVIEHGIETDGAHSISAEKMLEFVKELPSIQPEPHWIPVTERLPKEKDAGILKKLGKNKRSDYVIATVDVKGERMTVTACTYDGVWDWNMKYAFPGYEIVAWMEFPSPYKGEKNDNI